MASPLDPTPEPPSLQAHRIEAYLRERILKRHIEAGERIPSERDLAKRFGAGRNSVREALRSLERQGLIKTGPGGNRAQPLSEASPDLIEHLIAIDAENRGRLLIETARVYEVFFPFAVAEAVRNADDGQVDEIIALLDAARTPGLDRDGFLRALDAVGDAVVRASSSLVLQLVMKPVLEALTRRLEGERAGPTLADVDAELDDMARSFGARRPEAVAANAGAIMAAYTRAFENRS